MDIINMLIYFLVGFVFDILITYYYIKINERDAWIAGLMSTLITSIQVFALYWILLAPDMIDRTLAYSIGCGVGTVITIQYFNRKKKNEQISNSASN